MRSEQTKTGFSLIELMMVVVVMLIVMAIGIPSLMNSYRTYQINASLRDIANVVYRAKFEAIRSNRLVSVIGSPPLPANFPNPGNWQWMGIDLDNDRTLGLTTLNLPNLPRGTIEPRIILPTGITLVAQPGGGPFIGSINSMGPEYNPGNTGIPDNFLIQFNPHGSTQATLNNRPGVTSTGNVVPNAVIFIQDNFGNWGAVTVSVMGAVRTWRATQRNPNWR